MVIFRSYVSLPEGNHQFLAASPFFGSTHPAIIDPAVFLMLILFVSKKNGPRDLKAGNL